MIRKNFYLSETEIKNLELISKREGITISELIRHSIGWYTDFKIKQYEETWMKATTSPSKKGGKHGRSSAEFFASPTPE